MIATKQRLILLRKQWSLKKTNSRSYPEYGSCELLQIPSKYDFKPYAYGFQKDSPYLPLFNYYLKEMREKGRLEKIRKDLALRTDFNICDLFKLFLGKNTTKKGIDCDDFYVALVHNL